PGPAVAASPLREEAAAWRTEWEEEGAEPPRAAQGPVAGRPRIVVVEESAGLRAHLVHLLGRDWEVVGLSDGAEALAVVKEHPPDLVLAEVVLPHLDGLALLGALRANPATATVPMMLIASRPGEEAAVDALEHGPDDYLVKPFSGRLLVARVRASLASARARRKQQAQLQASLEITQATLTGEGIEAVLKLVARRARDLLEADGAHVAIPAAAEGLRPVTIGDGCACGDLLAAAKQGGELAGETVVGSRRVIAPLAVQAQPIGVLGVCRQAGGEPFAPEDAQLLALFANQAALAMEQGRVYQVMQRLSVMEEERARIARDIHDDTLQSLGAITLRLSLVAKGQIDEDQRRSIEGLLGLTRDSAERLRALVFDLRADVLEQGLIHALQSYVFEAPTPLPLRCRIVSRLRTEPPMHVSLVLYRVAQEALTNVRRHALASTVRLTLDEVRGGIRLRVHDDGRGFVPRAGPGVPGHLGLAGMRERAELAGGSFSIESSPGRGTTVQVWIPVPGGMPPRLS
ncbi:MAG: response regulator, partial [Candidatus Dormiibacterota bacterium]